MVEITKIVSQKKDPNRVSIFIDDEFAFGIHVNVLARHNLYKGLKVEESTLQVIQKEELHERFFNRVMGYLDRGIKPEYRIRTYLNDLYYKKKGDWFAEEVIDKDLLVESVMTRVHKVGAVNDEAYASAFVRDRLRSKPKSKFALVGELLGKGVSKDIAQSVCNELVDDEFDIMVRAYRKKYKNEPLLNDDRKKIDFLRRKGFKWDLISRLINNDTGE